MIAVAQQKFDLAIECCRRALEFRPGYFDAQINLGAILAMQGSFDEAAACLRRALELKPDSAEACNNLAVVLREQDHPDEAIVYFERCFSCNPAMPRQLATWETCSFSEAESLKHESASLKLWRFRPEEGVWRLNIASLCPTVFNTAQELDLYREQLSVELEESVGRVLNLDLVALTTANCIPSFNLPFHGYDDRAIREAYAKVFCNCIPSETATGSPGGRRIGFVVTDQHERLFIRSLAGVLDRLNPDLFELVILGSARKLPVLRAAIRNPAVKLCPLPAKFQQIVDAIRAARCDVLYYWEVGTDCANYFLPFHRLAPVQCTSWGIQVTSGIPQMDYYLSSELVETDGARAHYTERLVLAKTLLTYQQRVSLPAVPKKREDFGLATEQHIYLCAQQLGKFHPEFDAILAGILRRDARGLVVCREDSFDRFTADRLRRRFVMNMPDVARRILFLPFQANADYLSLVGLADVLLDPLHFGGVNSSYDGFSLNQPIVTLPSQYQRGRYTLGCYRKMGLMDCVATNLDHYVDIAVALATDSALRTGVVEKIQRASDRLFDDIEAVHEHERILSALLAKSPEMKSF